MRVIVEAYRDGQTVPFIDKLKVDISDEDQLLNVSEDIHEFVSNNFYRLEDEDVSSD